MKKLYFAVLSSLAALVACPLMAQTTPGGTSLQNTSSIITSPPRTMSSMPVAQTPGADSTMWNGNVTPSVADSSISLPLPSSGGGSSPPATCTAGTSTASQPANCPVGYLTMANSATFTQTQTVTTACPGGSYGTPSTTYGTWSPASDTSTCPLPTANNNPAICMSNGGMPYSVTPLKITDGGYAAVNVASFSGTSTSRWNAVGSYTATVSFNGASTQISDVCTRANSTDGIGIVDLCDHSTTVSVGGGTFVISTSATAPVTGDWVYGTAAPYGAQGTVTQTNCLGGNSSNPSICYAHGGMPYTTTANMAWGPYTASGTYLKAVTTQPINGSPTTSYTVSFNGATQTITDTCTQWDVTGTTCKSQTTAVVGGGTFTVSTSATVVVSDLMGTYSYTQQASGSILQSNCQ